jgi:virulence-associated protein VapD
MIIFHIFQAIIFIFSPYFFKNTQPSLYFHKESVISNKSTIPHDCKKRNSLHSIIQGVRLFTFWIIRILHISLVLPFLVGLVNPCPVG